MRTVLTETPAGEEWAVRVVWQPRWPLLVRRFGGWRVKRRARRGIGEPDVSQGMNGLGNIDIGDDLVVGLAIIIGMIVFGILFWWLLLPLLLVFVDLAVVIVLLLLAIPARVLLGRPWTVEAVTTKAADQRLVALVVGWRAALRKRDEIAAALASGQSPVTLGELTAIPTDAPAVDPTDAASNDPTDAPAT